MKKNGNEVLKFIYKGRMMNKTAKELYQKVKTKWPKCSDITVDDINDMFMEIDIVHRSDFVNGR